MAIALLAPDRDLCGLVKALNAIDPELDLRQWPDLGDLSQIQFAVCWHPPKGILAQLPALKAATSLGAGADALLSDPTLPKKLNIGRLSGPQLSADMSRWLVARVFAHWYQLDRFADQQRDRAWQPWAPSRAPHVGILGMGVLGRHVARAFQALDITVSGWNRSGTGPVDVHMYRGQEELLGLAGQVDYLICLLPLTAETRHILNHQLFAAMRPDAVLINVGRGQHLVEADLIEALNQQQLALAILDVFDREPLPADHPFWTHPSVVVSPHCAALSQDQEVAELILESYQRVKAGQTPLGLVNRQSGY